MYRRERKPAHAPLGVIADGTQHFFPEEVFRHLYKILKMMLFQVLLRVRHNQYVAVRFCHYPPQHNRMTQSRNPLLSALDNHQTNFARRFQLAVHFASITFVCA